MKISFNNRTTRQLVYISENVKGTFLSERALMDLVLIPINFPEPPDTCQATAPCKVGPIIEDSMFSSGMYSTKRVRLYVQ